MAYCSLAIFNGLNCPSFCDRLGCKSINYKFLVGKSMKEFKDRVRYSIFSEGCLHYYISLEDCRFDVETDPRYYGL